MFNGPKRSAGVCVFYNDFHDLDNLGHKARSVGIKNSALKNPYLTVTHGEHLTAAEYENDFRNANGHRARNHHDGRRVMPDAPRPKQTLRDDLLAELVKRQTPRPAR